MKVIDNYTIVVYNSNELKSVLEEDNLYNYVYLGDNISLDDNIVVNSNKKSITIDGTYLDIEYSYNNSLSDKVISTSNSTKEIVFKNSSITSCNDYGVISVANDSSTSDAIFIYDNITFNGVELSYNLYGTTKIIDSTIVIEDNNGVSAKRCVDGNKIILGGNTTISSSASTSTVFLYSNTISEALLHILPNSSITINTNKEIFNGCSNLDFKVLYNSVVNFNTGNGFAITTYHGCKDVLIDSNSVFTLKENSHQRVPMWNIYGDLTVNEGAEFNVINNCSIAPVDNYNIYFKGSNQNIYFNNPKAIRVFSLKSNALYSVNDVNFIFKFDRLNTWSTIGDYNSEGSISSLPEYSFYKDNTSFIKGVFNSGSTTIIDSNYNDGELDSFKLNGLKVLSIGSGKVNIHPIYSSSNSIDGYVNSNEKVLVSYNGVNKTLEVDENGLFECVLDSNLSEGDIVSITTCIDNSFIYTTRSVSVPFNGELTLMDSTHFIKFNKSNIDGDYVVRDNSMFIKVIDSRNVSKSFNILLSYVNPLETDSNVLIDSLYFKKFDNSVISIKSIPKVIYTGEGNEGNITVNKIIYPSNKGLIVKKDNIGDANTHLIWNLES